MKTWLALIMISLGVSGCAGPRALKELRHLRAEMGLLDQRVAQLERLSVQQPLPAKFLSEAPAQPTTATPAPKPSAVTWVKPLKKDIQQALKNAGFYHGSIDGIVGSKTHQAIREFQQANGLTADGIVGRHTWEKLAPHLHAPGVPQGAGGPASSTPEQTSQPFQK